MVERLRAAVARARAARAARIGGASAPGGPALADRRALWTALEPLAARFDEGGDAADPTRAAFDMLRIRLLRLLSDNNWSRIAITSARRGVGKTFVSLGLARALARNPDVRVMLLDFDFHAPGVAAALGAGNARQMEAFLAGEVRAEDHFLRLGENLMVGLNSAPAGGAGGPLLGGAARAALDDAIARYRPTVVLFDLPPLRSGGDAIGVLDHVDGALLIAEAGATRAREIVECEQLIVEHAHLIGVLLNKAEAGDGAW